VLCEAAPLNEPDGGASDCPANRTAGRPLLSPGTSEMSASLRQEFADQVAESSGMFDLHPVPTLAEHMELRSVDQSN
jgi:hypothetical protein